MNLFTRNQIFCLTLSFTGTPCAGHNDDLASQQYLKKGSSKHCLRGSVFWRVFDKLSNDIYFDRLCTCGALILDV